MFCKNCGAEIRDEAKFCSECGKLAAAEINISTDPINKKISKKLIITIVSILTVVFIIVIVPKGNNSIVGTWKSSEGSEYSFADNGQFTHGNHYGTYTIYDNNQLTLIYKDFDWLTEKYTYDFEINGNTLILKGTEYYKQ